MKEYQQPDFRQIYLDIITSKYPEKYNLCEYLLKKKEFLALDIMKINHLIFASSEKDSQKYRSYKKTDILQILDYQRKKDLNNSQLANHFKMSRNTIAKWKKVFQL